MKGQWRSEAVNPSKIGDWSQASVSVTRARCTRAAKAAGHRGVMPERRTRKRGHIRNAIYRIDITTTVHNELRLPHVAKSPSGLAFPSSSEAPRDNHAV